MYNGEDFTEEYKKQLKQKMEMKIFLWRWEMY